MVNCLAVVGVITSVVGLLSIVLGLVLGLYVIPNLLEEGVEESLVLKGDETDSDSYRRFTEFETDLLDDGFEMNLYYRGHVAFNIDNPVEFATGAEKVAMSTVGPRWWIKDSSKKNPVYDDATGFWTYDEVTRYKDTPEYNEAEGCDSCNDNTSVTFINYGISNVLYPIAQQLDVALQAGDRFGTTLGGALNGTFVNVAGVDAAQSAALLGDALSPAYWAGIYQSGLGEVELKIYIGGLIADGAHSNIEGFAAQVLLAASFSLLSPSADTPAIHDAGSFLSTTGIAATKLENAFTAMAKFPTDFLLAADPDAINIEMPGTSNDDPLDRVCVAPAAALPLLLAAIGLNNSGDATLDLNSSDVAELIEYVGTEYANYLATPLVALGAGNEYADTDAFVMAGASLTATPAGRFQQLRDIMVCPGGTARLAGSAANGPCSNGMDSRLDFVELETFVDYAVFQSTKLSMTRNSAVTGSIESAFADVGTTLTVELGLTVREIANLLEYISATEGDQVMPEANSPDAVAPPLPPGVSLPYFDLEVVLANPSMIMSESPFTVTFGGSTSGAIGKSRIIEPTTLLSTECSRAAFDKNAGLQFLGGGANFDQMAGNFDAIELYPVTDSGAFAFLMIEAAVMSQISAIVFNNLADAALLGPDSAAVLQAKATGGLQGYDNTFPGFGSYPADVFLFGPPLVEYFPPTAIAAGMVYTMEQADASISCAGKGAAFVNWGNGFVKNFLDNLIFLSYPQGCPLMATATLKEISFGYEEPLVKVLTCDLSGPCSEACVGTDLNSPDWLIGITTNNTNVETQNGVDSGAKNLKDINNWVLNDGTTSITARTGLSVDELLVAEFAVYTTVVDYSISEGLITAEAGESLKNVPAGFCDPDTDDDVAELYGNALLNGQITPEQYANLPSGCGWNGILEDKTQGKGGIGIGPEWDTYGYTFEEAWNNHVGLSSIGTFDTVVNDDDRATNKAFYYYSSLLYRTSPLENTKTFDNDYGITLDYYELPVEQLSAVVAGQNDPFDTTLFPDFLDIYFASGLKNLYCLPLYLNMPTATKDEMLTQFKEFPDADANEVDHEIHIDVEPFTGASMGGFLRLQANFYFPENTFKSVPYLSSANGGVLSDRSYCMSGNDITGALSNGYVVPALYALESTEISEFFAGKFKEAVYDTMDLADNLTFGLTIAGSLFVINGALLVAYVASKNGGISQICASQPSEGLAKRDSLAANLV